MTPLEQDLFEYAQKCYMFRINGNCLTYKTPFCTGDGPGVSPEEARAFALETAPKISELAPFMSWTYDHLPGSGDGFEAYENEQCSGHIDGAPLVQPLPRKPLWPWVAGGLALAGIGAAVTVHQRRKWR